jgi:hypothetical protein
MTASTRSQTDNFKVMRSILTELVPKAQVGEVSRLMALAVHAGYNDFYLREADENVIQSMFGCDELFTRGVMAKILSKLRANELPPPAEPASPEDYQVAINHAMQRSLILWCDLAFQKHALWCTEQGLDIRQLSHSKICSRFLL